MHYKELIQKQSEEIESLKRINLGLQDMLNTKKNAIKELNKGIEYEVERSGKMEIEKDLFIAQLKKDIVELSFANEEKDIQINSLKKLLNNLICISKN